MRPHVSLVTGLTGLLVSTRSVYTLPTWGSWGTPASSSLTYHGSGLTSDGSPSSVEGDFASAAAAGHAHQWMHGDSAQHFHHLDPNNLQIPADHGGLTHVWSLHVSPPGNLNVEQMQRAMGAYEAVPLQETMQESPSLNAETTPWSISGRRWRPVPILMQDLGSPSVSTSSFFPAEDRIKLQTLAQHQSSAHDQWKAARDELPLTLAERHALAQTEAQWKGSHHAMISDDAHWSIPTVLASSEQAASQSSTYSSWSHPAFPDAAEPLAEPVSSPQVHGGQTDSNADEAHHHFWESRGAIIADNSWNPPYPRTFFQERIEKAGFAPKSELLQPRTEGKARFYGAIQKGTSTRGLLRYASVPDLAAQMTLVRLSGKRLLALRDVWNRIGLKLLFAQTDNVAYGIADARLLKGFFPRLSEEDKQKLPDGQVAIIQVEKVGKTYQYNLYGVLDSAFFRHLRI